MNSWFSRTLLNWNRLENHRQMPWKGEKDPYRIWLSEIILQQTRVEQGRAYYERFISSFSTVSQLASAPQQEVFKLWEGLGYYSRCRNMTKAAQAIVEQFNGRFPDSYKDVLSLPGVGPYTAAAICSFAYNQPFAVVDGNVYRILARIFEITIPVDSDAGKKHFNTLATDLLDKENSAEYNQAIMDFGATVCKPKNPLCNQCPFHDRCNAYKHNTVYSYPVKTKKLLRRTRYFYYFFLEKDDEIMVRERVTKDIWQHLYEPVLVEAEKELSEKEINPLLRKIGIPADSVSGLRYSVKHSQQLTHQQICGIFTHVSLKNKVDALSGYQWVNKSEFEKLPFPRYILSYLKEKK
ncbi:A/G-specific adenine glycosylase [Pollutibacter soli]|uniref:A/G-specific adenine glycosylase n=1 Tax=Pollutibacter soli TaxID=3034157 RepID=UPI003013B441